ncbi:MAG: hypothetical protein QNJ97_06605 [Myxococcota bacterium]|nr:hypothetical protein [Myxococcota bacterium]
MKMRIIGISLAIPALFLSTCKDESAPTLVYGYFDCDQCDGRLEVNGSVAESGEDYYGWCERDGDDLNIAVGSDNPSLDGFGNGKYFEIRGIDGPPEDGVYNSDGQIKNDEDNYTTFSSAKIVNVHTWKVKEDDIPDDGSCYVRLYAEADEGELSQEDYGSNPFDVFVQIICSGALNVTGTPTGAVLEGMNVKAWFKNCD